ncbi:MAG: acyl-ACP--UDP-N-acetylglucosamine O-acyltransferase [Bacteroidetes bacterium]|nr:acyl-ACP--UDP-N-acetylglucosamine O-acyltransferase [Bacteroidota bacterium]MCW5896545.1 acyl-ACP--UDP-N-acetylglucosamine O-acyltransferase [Bacteroidota bacterium]
MATHIDPRSDVNPKAELGHDVTVGPFAVIEAGAVIGEGTSIASNALIGRGARIGKDCRIHHGAIVGHVPQDLKYKDEPTTCEVGDRNVIREYATLHRGTVETGKTVIGSDNLLMGYVHIAHDCVLGNNIIMSNAAMLAGHVHVDDFAIIGGITPVHQFVRIGAHVMIGGGLRVPKDVPPFVRAAGEPLVFAGLNSVGLRRRGFSREAIEALDRTYSIIYNSGLNVSQAVAKVKEDASLMKVPEVQKVLDFIAQSKRGIITRHRDLH